MAETSAGMGGGAVPIDRPSAQETVVGSAQELIEQAPPPTEEDGKKYRVLYPTDQFVMEGHPVVTSSGTALTNEQAEALLPVAEASGVRIVEVED